MAPTLSLHHINPVFCPLQEKATPSVLLSLVTANFSLTQCTRLSIQAGTKPSHCKWGEKDSDLFCTLCFYNSDISMCSCK